LTVEITPGLVDRIVDLSYRAGDVIMDIYRTDFEIRAKSDHSLVTEADDKAEELILAELAEILPGIPAIGEESYTAGARPDISAGEFWLVDALDGTKEFVNRNGEFTVNIALVQDGVATFGVVYGPAIGDTYIGAPDGAFRETRTTARKPISARIPAEDGLVIVSSRSHRAEEDEFLKSYTVKGEINRGSSLKFCLIAAGEADMYPRLVGTSEWDTAAGQAVLEAAGGSIMTLDGVRLAYGKDVIRNPHFIARGLTP